MRVLVTGAAGFIGCEVALRLLARGDQVLGLDNLNDYYDVRLKHARLQRLQHPSFQFAQLDVADRTGMQQLIATEPVDRVVHLAAQAGVRYSIDNPQAYLDSNLTGFGHILELARQQRVAHLVFASSSSVYGANTKVPFSEHDNVDHAVSLYAATKKANEVMAHSYAHLYRLPCTGLRFFTVYGPWGRPDMALFKFTRAILAGEPIPVFNHGQLERDFTYIDDIVEGVIRVLDQPAQPDPAWSGDRPDPATSAAPYRVFNIGNCQPTPLMTMIQTLEQELGRSAVLDMQPMQPGDVYRTAADTADLEQAVGFRPNTSLREGIARFVTWYRSYHQL